MALTVEDGTALTDADSYSSVADADTYQANRGITLWATMSNTEKEWSLRRATDYMGQIYKDKWKGSRVSGDQALDWPRKEVDVNGFTVLSTTVPVVVRNACIELAFRAASGPLTQDVGLTGQFITKEKVGPIETEYSDAYEYAGKNLYQSIDAYLEAYFLPTGYRLTGGF